MEKKKKEEKDEDKKIHNRVDCHKSRGKDLAAYDIRVVKLTQNITYTKKNFCCGEKNLISILFPHGETRSSFPVCREIFQGCLFSHMYSFPLISFQQAKYSMAFLFLACQLESRYLMKMDSFYCVVISTDFFFIVLISQPICQYMQVYPCRIVGQKLDVNFNLFVSLRTGYDILVIWISPMTKYLKGSQIIYNNW